MRHVVTFFAGLTLLLLSSLPSSVLADENVLLGTHIAESEQRYDAAFRRVTTQRRGFTGRFLHQLGQT